MGGGDVSPAVLKDTDLSGRPGHVTSTSLVHRLHQVTSAGSPRQLMQLGLTMYVD